MNIASHFSICYQTIYAEGRAGALSQVQLTQMMGRIPGKRVYNGSGGVSEGQWIFMQMDE